MLRAIEQCGSATIGELAHATGLHENTLREHLSRLREDGRVRAHSAEAQGRGRPAQLWSAVDPASTDAYVGLVAALARALAQSADGSKLAYAAGQEWAARLVAERGTSDDANLLMDVMRELGFDPAGDESDFELRRCPLRDTAAEHPEVVCAAHAGLIAGITRSQSPALKSQLTPFAGPERCLVQLRQAS